MTPRSDFSRCEIHGLPPRPALWRVRPPEVLDTAASVTGGECGVLATTPGGWDVPWAAFGPPRATGGQATWASASNSPNVAAYKTDLDGTQVVVLACGVHGAEAEAVAGAVNLIRLLDTGKDLAGNERPGLVALAASYRLVILPCVNMDGRAVSPDHLRGASREDFVRASQGQWADGTNVGYPVCKEYVPLPLDRVVHPGGYPNAEGYNIMHDVSPGDPRTAEARGLLKLIADEQADLVVHMHSHSIGACVLGQPLLAYPLHVTRTEAYKHRVHDALAEAGLRPADVRGPDNRGGVNLVSASAQASGALAVTVEQPTTDAWTFQEMLETFYVIVETFLRFGIKEPFSPRESVARGRQE